MWLTFDAADTDVLVMGGGAAACMAAISAHAAGAKTLVIDKGQLRKIGLFAQCSWRNGDLPQRPAGRSRGFGSGGLEHRRRKLSPHPVSPDVGTHRFASDLGVCGPKALRTVADVLGMAGVWAIAYGWRVFLAFRVCARELAEAGSFPYHY